MTRERQVASERIAWLVETLQLQPHPEGGRYRRIFASDARVQPEDGRGARPALTAIHYLLVAGECSQWHRVASDEAWHYLEGAPLQLSVADAAFTEVTERVLGPFADDAAPLHIVPRGQWQRARSTGAYTLVACTVGPGFDFADFDLLATDG